MSETPKLLPCPFCGGEAKARADDYFDDRRLDGWRIRCATPECRGNVTYCIADLAKAIAAWNARADSALAADRERVAPCDLCGGPHAYDTSLPSEQWNRVIRAQGLPDYLCASCIVAAFVKARESFSAELYGDAVNRDGDEVPTIAVRVGSVQLGNTYGDLDYERRLLAARYEALRKAAQAVVDHYFDPHAAPMSGPYEALRAALKEST